MEYSYIFGSDYTESSEVMGVISYFTFFLLLNSMVPISLIISLETLKWLQTMWLEFDEKMHEKDEVIIPIMQYFKVLNATIHEELGKIEYIFSDKTGTLTCNDMVFRFCCIQGISYGEGVMEDVLRVPQVGVIEGENARGQFQEFWLGVVLCHDAMIDEKTQEYCGSSPDEVALVKAASRFGFKFLKKTHNSIFIKIEEEMLIYELVCQIEFTSDRKRMSVLVKDMQTD